MIVNNSLYTLVCCCDDYSSLIGGGFREPLKPFDVTRVWSCRAEHVWAKRVPTFLMCVSGKHTHTQLKVQKGFKKEKDTHLNSN